MIHYNLKDRREAYLLVMILYRSIIKFTHYVGKAEEMIVLREK